MTKPDANVMAGLRGIAKGSAVEVWLRDSLSDVEKGLHQSTGELTLKLQGQAQALQTVLDALEASRR
jgi:hypothetical protein